MRLDLIVVCFSFSLLFEPLFAEGAAGRSRKEPNVILLIVDDMGYGDIAAHGNPVVKTPNFDRLHNESARLTNFAVSPSCSPTRAALMTGRHEFLSNVSHTVHPMKSLDPKATTMAQIFKASGYKTGLFGKWHLGQKGELGPWNRGFDETLTAIDDTQNSHSNPVLLKNKVRTKFKGYRTDILFDNAMDFIQRHKEETFFCYLSTYTPHTPLKVPAGYSRQYENNKQMISGRFSTALFNGMVSNVDHNLGRLLAHIDELGISDDTLVIAINDNGGTMGVDVHNGGMRGVKGTGWLGGLRAYSFWRWGKNFKPGPRNTMSGHIDVLPTLADVCDLGVPADLKSKLEGGSLLPALRDETNDFRKDHMQVHHVGRWAYPKLWRQHKYANSIVRWNQYYLVRMDGCTNKKCGQCEKQPRNARNSGIYTNEIAHHRVAVPGKWELYDIEQDVFQENDISDAHPAIVSKMTEFYESWWKRAEVSLEGYWGSHSKN